MTALFLTDRKQILSLNYSVLFCLSIFPVLMWALLLTGCGTPVSDSVREAVEEDVPVIGTVTLIRTEAEPTADELLVSVTGTLSAVVGNLSYATIYLPAGTNTVVFDWDDSPMKFREEVVLEPGAMERYLAVAHKFAVPEISKKEDRTDYTMEETLILFELPIGYATNVIKNLDPTLSYSFDAPE